MTFPPDRPASGMENPTLKAGLAALKQGNYLDAIAHLESVCEIDQSQNAIFKAQMGLVVAYERSGNPQKAIALCRNLSTNSNPQVKTWAVRSLDNLAKLYPEQTKGELPASQSSAPSTPSDTGFVPINPTAQTSSRPKIPPTSPPLTGKKPEAQGSTSGILYPPGAEVSGRLKEPDSGRLPNKSNTLNSQSPISSPQSPKLPTNSSEKIQQKPEQQEEKETKSPAYQPEWKQAQRATRWPRLPAKTGFQFDLSQLWGVQAVTAIALFISVYWFLNGILRWAIFTVTDILVKLRLTYRNEDGYNDPTRFAPIAAAILGIALIALSPWLIDSLLRVYYGLKPISLDTLTAKSPEAARVLQRFCRERRLPLPTLGILPDRVPLALTYGNIPRTARIVVTQGLLEQLADDEIATIYAAQLGHIVNWDFVLMSLGVLVTQVPYTFYWRVSEIGERWQIPFLRYIAGAIAALFYGIYWLFRWLILWLSRARVYYSDRIACEITGNPNGLTRALLKIAIGIAKDIQQQGKTSYLLEGFDPLAPVGYRQAITLGSLYAHTPLEPILAWDYLNPHRRWLTINNSHPLLGERLQILDRYARYWKLDSELNFTQNSGLKNQKSNLFLQGSPYFGFLLGLGMTGFLWLIGLISSVLKIRQIPLDWMLGDRSLLYGCLLIGISIGIFWRINPFFPDIKPSNLLSEEALPDLLANPTAMPVDSQAIRLQGKLLGRPGISNWLCQDLMVQTATGLIKLHYFSWLGSFGNLLFNSSRPSELVNRPIVATGWFRRGATLWVDADTLRTQTGKISQSWHPIWSTLLAIAAAAWGVYIIYRGG